MSEFNSILSGCYHHDWNHRQPEFFHDLQLDYLLKIMERQGGGYDIRPYFYTFPADSREVRFRQQVYRDFHDPDTAEAFHRFCVRMQRSRRSYELGRQCKEELHQYSYHLEGAACYREAVSLLYSDLKECAIYSSGLNNLTAYLQSYLESQDCRTLFQDIQEAAQMLDRIRFHLQVGEDCLTIVESEEEPRGNDYIQELRDLLQVTPKEQEEVLTAVFPNVLEPSLFETTLVQILEKKTPDIFSAIRVFAMRHSSYFEEKILQTEREVSFYLSSLEFERQTRNKGYPTITPALTDTREFSADGVYDMALLWKNSLNREPVVDNDFSYPGVPSFFVVTGPNQGGKTTFARAAGQAVYMALMGLNAPCRKLTIPFFTGISTHFEVEESVKSNSGKLKEEIDRLKPMMEQSIRNQFIILNELFTTATTYDATLMGRRVMEHFLERGCCGIYVTHIQELAEETNQIQSLVAQIDAEDAEKRTYKLLPMKAQGYGYADTLVKKFSLTYEDIMRRLP